MKKQPSDVESSKPRETEPISRHRLISHLTAFYYAGRTGSIQAGARALGINRNSLARYLDELDDLSPTPLRNSNSEIRGLDLTEAGRHLLALLEPLVSRLETVTAQWRGGLAELRLGCQSSTSSYLLPGWIRAFEVEQLKGQLEEAGAPRISLKTGSSEAILEALHTLEVDVGIIATESDRALTEGGIVYVPLFRENLIAICPRAHPFARSGPVPAERFVRHPQYLYYQGGRQYQERINALAPGAGATRQMEFDTIQAIKETVRAGLGISIIPGGAIREEDKEWLAVVPLEVPPPHAARLTRVIAAVTRENDDLTPLAREFLSFLRSHRRDLLTCG
jgi:DNA-binding transcriptional LysR family regulator